MSFSYDPADLETELNRIRLEIGDTDSLNYFLLDEEIAIIQSELSSFNARCAKCCGLIANKFSAKTEVRFDGYSEKFSEIVERYRKMAEYYGNLSAGSYPYSSSIYQDDKDTYQNDVDIVQPAFKRGMHDNT